MVRPRDKLGNLVPVDEPAESVEPYPPLFLHCRAKQKRGGGLPPLKESLLWLSVVFLLRHRCGTVVNVCRRHGLIGFVVDAGWILSPLAPECHCQNISRLSSLDFRLAQVPNAGLGHGCASTPANARPPHLSSLVSRLYSILARFACF